MKLSDRTKRRKLRDVSLSTWHVPMVQRSAKFALQSWKTYHPALFALTMLLRCILNAVPKLRKACFHNCHIYIYIYIYRGSKRIEQSNLFRTFLDRSSSDDGCKFKTFELTKLGEAICSIHCHNVSAKGDLLHQKTKNIICSQTSQRAQIRAAVFFLNSVLSFSMLMMPSCARSSP